MREMTFLVNDQATGSGPTPSVAVTITENTNGTLGISLAVLGGVVGDLRGFFFDIANESRIGSLSVIPTSAGFTEFRQGNDSIKDLGNGANMQGLLGSDGGYDAGVEIGTPGIGKDDYHSFSFTLKSSAGPLTLEDFANVDIGVRLTSVGRDGTCGDGRDGEAKLLEHMVGAYDAKDDARSIAEDAAPNRLTGNVFGNDVNVAPIHLITAVNGTAANIGSAIQGTYGTLQVALDGSYTYTLDNTRAAVQALADGQHVVESFSYSARSFDELTSSSSDSASILITVTGTNDAPTVTAAVSTGAVDELANGSPDEGSATLSATGAIDFSDLDLSDAHSVSISPAASDYLGTLTAAVGDPATGDGTGQIEWVFEVSDAALDHLGAGELVTQTYSVSVNDGHGGIASQDVTITITGASDNTPPTAVADTNDGDPVVESGVGAFPFPPRGDSFASGNVLANDIDPDPNPGLHVTSVDGDAGNVGNLIQGNYGDVQIQADGSWSYFLNNADADALAQDERAFDQFTYTATDAAGASSTTTLTIAIDGTNDVPIFAPGGNAGDVTEDIQATASGHVAAVDPDHGAVVRYQVNGTTGFAADYHFAIDQFTITRQRPGDPAPIQVLNDTFSDNNPPPSSPPFSNGVAAGYGLRGAFTENGGFAFMDGALAQTTFNFGAPAAMLTNSALALTNITNDLTQGLRITHTFDATGRFDAILPGRVGEGYGIALSDQNINVAGDDTIQLMVRRDEDGQVRVELREADQSINTVTPIDSIALAPIHAGEQIVLHLAHNPATPGQVTGSFEVMDGGSIVQSHTFAGQGQIYGTETPGFTGDDENFTRAQFFATGPATTTLRTGTYGTLSLDSNTGDWHYTLDNNDPDTQALAQGATAVDSFQAIGLDQFNVGTLATIDVTVHGTNDAPVAVNDSASTSEDAATNIAVLANDHDPDTGDVLHVAGVGSASGSGLSTLGARLTVNADGTVQYDPRSSAALQALNTGETLNDTFSYAALDQNGAPGVATVTVAVQGAAEAPTADGQVFEDGSRHASGHVTPPPGVDTSGPLTWTVTNPSVIATPDYRFSIDNLQIARNGTVYFNDGFDAGGPPPQAPNLTGTTTGVSYAMTGSFIESGGRGIMDGSLSAPAIVVPGSGPFHQNSALLLTDTSPNLALGLKNDDSFSVTGLFDLVQAGDSQAYGIRLLDQAGNDLIDLRVRGAADGTMSVLMRDVDTPAGIITNLASVPLVLASGENQIALRLTHDVAHPGDILASFDLLGGAVPRTFNLGAVGHIFGTGTPGDPSDDEVFTRVQILAVAPSDQQNGVYGTLHVNANGDWTYALDNAAPIVQALAQGEHATDTFNLSVSDGHGGFGTKSLSVDVVGTDDAPIVASAQPSLFNGAYVVEDGRQQTASGQFLASDPDHGASLHWSASVTPFSTNYLVKLDDLAITKNGASFFHDDFVNPPAPPASPDPNLSYGTAGTFSESDGRAVMDGQLSAAQRGVGTSDLVVGHTLTLLSNIDPSDLTRGLKSDDDFTVAARFDLSLPTENGQGYGVSLVDGVNSSLPPDQLGDDLVTLELLRDVNGNTRVRFVDRDLVADTTTELGSVPFAALSGEDQIVLQLTHAVSDPGAVHASFDVFNHGAFSRHVDLAGTGHIFGTGTPGYAGDDEDWTRVQLLAFGRDAQPSQVHGTFGDLSIDPLTGAWNYALNNDSPSTQALSHGQVGTDAFNVRVTDEYGVTSNRPFTIGVVGTGAPEPTGPISFLGSPASDVFVGSSGADTLTGAGGSDLLVGRDGADTFDYNSLNDGLDVISDFTPGVGGDRLDLHDLLASLGPAYVPGVSNPADFVHLAEINQPGLGPTTTVLIDPDGVVGGTLTPIAHLQGTTGLQVSDMLANGNLIV